MESYRRYSIGRIFFLNHMVLAAILLLMPSGRVLGQVAAFGTSPAVQVQQSAAQIDRAMVPSLIKDLQDAKESVRLRAPKELGKLGARDAIPALQKAVQDTDEDVRIVAARSLKAIQAAGANEQVQRLIQDLQNADDTVRLRAAKELGNLGVTARDAVRTLQKRTQDPDENVRQMAAAALTRVTSSAAPGLTRPDLFMLSVGIDKYLPPANLQGCVNDADGMAAVFQRQADKMYNKVQIQRLTETDASRAAIEDGLTALRKKGKAGDWYVIFLSGHGGTRLNRWGFLTQDNGSISDAALLELADELAGADKKVVLIIDACQVGQLRYAAHPILNKHTDPRKGGIILMISSMPSQVSRALGRYSAFARAVEEGLSGMADYNHDQTITMQELRRYTYNRVYQLILDSRSWPGLSVTDQDSAIDASMSIPETTPIARGEKKVVAPSEPQDGPMTAKHELAGVWTSDTYRLSLGTNGTFQAVWTPGGGRPRQSGDGSFKVTAMAVLLHHKQGTDRLEVMSLTSEELRFRFQGQEKLLRRETPTTPSGSVAATIWTGSETLAGFGKLAFQFQIDGKAIMTDAKSTIEGDWVQSGNEVTVTFSNCVYIGRVQGNLLSGTAHFTGREVREWTFSLTRGLPPTPTPSNGHEPVPGQPVGIQKDAVTGSQLQVRLLACCSFPHFNWWPPWPARPRRAT